MKREKALWGGYQKPVDVHNSSKNISQSSAERLFLNMVSFLLPFYHFEEKKNL